MARETSGPIVVKIGGSTLGAHDTSLADCAALHREGRRVVIVHGGGARVSEWLERLAVPSEFADGLRKTTAESREVVVAVLAGLVNKELVQQLQRLGVRAVGLSGADGGTLRAPINTRGLGYVGEAPVCDPSMLCALLEAGALPVVASIGLSPGSEELLNINADTAAGAIAAALGAELLVFLTDVPGLLDGRGEIVDRLDRSRADALRSEGVLQGGMVPKVEACLAVAEAGGHAVILDGREAGAVARALTPASGTRFA